MKTILMYNTCLYKADEKKLSGGEKEIQILWCEGYIFQG